MDHDDSGSGGPVGVVPRRREPLVYVVDDEPSVVEVVSAFLDDALYRVRKFESATQAYAAFAAAEPKPDVLLVDYNMPEMNGLELLRRCRALVPGQKAISISGTITAELLSESDVKPDWILGKPFTCHDLLLAVGSLARRSRA
jgi:CheY-like chemotaxis protein